MNWKTFAILVPMTALAACDADIASPTDPAADLTPQLSKSAAGGRNHSETLGVVYVSSQGLYYDTFAAAIQLPPHGPFQLIADGMTEFGPGDQGYVGGRWWEDLNGNGVQDAGDNFFLCPLLGPGRTSP